MLGDDLLKRKYLLLKLHCLLSKGLQSSACDEMAMHGLLGSEKESYGSLIPHLDLLSTANI